MVVKLVQIRRETGWRVGGYDTVEREKKDQETSVSSIQKD